MRNDQVLKIISKDSVYTVCVELLHKDLGQEKLSSTHHHQSSCTSYDLFVFASDFSLSHFWGVFYTNYYLLVS